MLHLWKGGLWYDGLLEEQPIRTFQEVCQFLAKHLPRGLVIQETGTAYYYPGPQQLCHLSTPCFMKELVDPLAGKLYSYDIRYRGEVVYQMLQDWDVPREGLCMVLGESVKNMRDTPTDVLLLDSAEDAQHAVDEYNACTLNPSHYVLVDDIHQDASVKWRAVVPLLKSMGYDWCQIPLGTGLFLAARGYPLPPRKL